jgi:T5SS/PEP-CTERM-associated repeat protein
MANFQWTGSAGTNAFFTPGNWDTDGGTPASVPPGPNDSATIDNTAAAITGTGTAQFLIFQGSDEIAGHLVATGATPVRADLTLRPGAILTTPRLGVPAGTLTVGKDSSVVIFGPHDLNDYAIKVAVGAGSSATLLVHGERSVVNCRNLPMSVGQDGNGQMTIKSGAVVTTGNDDPLIYPWALVIGNHVSSTGQAATGKVTVSDASLVARGQIIVGRNGTGTLEMNARASVVAEDMAIGYAGPGQVTVSDASLVARGQVIVGQNATGTLEVNAGATVVVDDMSIGYAAPAGQGSVSVNGHNARLLVANALEVQHMGTGSLTVTGQGSVSAGMGIFVAGTLSLSDGQIETNALGVGTGGTLTGHGTVTAVAGFDVSGTITAGNSLSLIGDIGNSGTITVAAGGHLRCFGTLFADNGTIELQANSVATVEAVQTGQTIKFSGPKARLELRSPGAFSGIIDGFAKTHTIELDAQANSFTVVGSMLTISGMSGTVAQLQMTGSPSPNDFKLIQLPGGRSEIVHSP